MTIISIKELERILAELNLCDPIPKFSTAAASVKPLDLYRSYLADILCSLVDCEREAAYSSIQSPLDAENGDFAIALPKLCPGSKAKELAFELMKKFPPNHPLFPLPYLDVVQFRIFIKEESFPRLVLPYINECKAAYGYDTSFGRLHPTSDRENKKVVVEFSSPMVCDFEGKHLRSTVLGSFVSRLYENFGWDVVKINYLGDWGKPMALLEMGWEKFGSEEAFEADPAGHLINVYRQITELIQPEEQARKTAKKKSREDGHEQPKDSIDVDGELTAERNAIFMKMEEREDAVIDLFERIRETNIKHYESLYTHLGIEFDEYSGESQASQDTMTEVEQLLKDKGITEEKEGAWIIDPEKFGSKKGAKQGPIFIRDRSGATYLLRDLAAVVERSRKFDFDKMIYVVAADHDPHFSLLFKILSEMGMEDLAGKLHHVHFKKSPRAVDGLGIGHNPIHFLDQWETKMRATLDTDEDKTALFGNSYEVMKALGISGLLTQELSVRNDVYHPYDMDIGTSFKANTGPYLQYWYARLCSALSDLPTVVALSIDQYNVLADLDDQVNLLRMLAQYPEVTHVAYKSLDPLPITTYLGHLTKQIAECLTPDEEDDDAGDTSETEENSKEVDTAPALAAVYKAARTVLENGMTLLGYQPITKSGDQRADSPLAD